MGRDEVRLWGPPSLLWMNPLLASDLGDCPRDLEKVARSSQCEARLISLELAHRCPLTCLGSEGYQQLICDQQGNWNLHKPIACSKQSFIYL